MAYGGRGFGGGGGRSFDRGPRQMFDITCSDCGKPSQVPFKPTEGRPVFCRDCYSAKKPQFGGA